MTITHGSSTVTEREAAHAVAFADAALGVASHEITDPAIRDIMWAVARGEITSDEGVKRANAHIDSL